uniref:Uncharacterized protein n=1 Tax=Rhizophora mucronata TaxID=61149 RepID=A0A2P2R0C5_RHIMU
MREHADGACIFLVFKEIIILLYPLKSKCSFICSCPPLMLKEDTSDLGV